MNPSPRMIRSAFAAALLVTAFALGGCAMNAGSGNPTEAAVGEVDFSCRTDADCAIKNVGNCCGYYPACVNIDSPTFPEAVMAQCAAEDRMAVCGFPDIAGCQCVEGRCQPLDQGIGPLR